LRSKNTRRWCSGFATILAFAAIVLGLARAAEAANPTTLSINCTPKGVSPGAASSCIATVTDAGPVAARIPPGGTVSFTVEGAGTFDPGDTCALEPSGAFSSKCTVAYTPTAISGGSHRLLATYNGDDGHGRATSAFTLTVTPANDDLQAATPLSVPAKTTGTTEGATYSDDDPELCSDAYAPVWYSLKPTQSGRIAMRLTVRGRADSVVAVFRQDRSKLVALGCDLSNVAGVAGVPFDAARGATYLVAVAAPWSAVVGEFVLESVRVAAVTFPGVRLVRDADVALDPLLRPSAAFSLHLLQGTTYRIGASARDACVHAALLRSASAAAATVVESEGCSGYLVYTRGADTTGAFPLLVSMPEGRATNVHVVIRRAEADDLAPGLTISNGTVRHGALAARGGDVVDTYHFRVGTIADATIALRGTLGADLLLFDTKGKSLGCACDGRRSAEIVKRLAPGMYLTVVRARPAAAGRYGLTLRLRQPTVTGVRMTPTPGRHPSLKVSTDVRPTPGGGRLVLELDRFDPLSGWQFVASSSHISSRGRTSFALRPALGGWRVRVHYRGTLSASPSDSDWIAFTVDQADTAAQRAQGGTCVPGASTSLAIGAMTISCGGAPFGEKPTKTTQTPGAALRSLRSAVGGIATLRDPFKSDLLGTIDEAIKAVAAHNFDEARAQLDDLVTQLQATPLQAQMTTEQRKQLIDAAKRIEAQLG